MVQPNRKQQENAFKDFVLDQLGGLSGVRARAMFGGHGLYVGDAFIGIVWHGKLFFVTDEESREQYVARGMEPFRPREGQGLARYFEVPLDVLEDSRELTAWAQRALECRRS
jgi:DNA transformation protein